MLKKVVIIGPESTGKSQLCAGLAEHYNTPWCPEFAREYLLRHGPQYEYDDLLEIARGQVLLEEKYIKEAAGKKILFIDTDLYVMKVWCEFVFGKCHSYILKEIADRHYDLYLLCDTDLPWTKDELREYPDLQSRQRLYKMYRDILVHQSTPWQEIRGVEAARLENAIRYVDALL
jgi:NadR type nicotinamide-nucleotide adenylyltransferase